MGELVDFETVEGHPNTALVGFDNMARLSTLDITSLPNLAFLLFMSLTYSSLLDFEEITTNKYEWNTLLYNSVNDFW